MLGGATQLTKEAATLKEVVVSKQTQAAAATHEWEALSEEVPKMVKAIESRVDTLSGSRKLPKDVNKEAFEAAKAALAVDEVHVGRSQRRVRRGQCRRGRGQGPPGPGQGRRSGSASSA